MPRQGQNAYRRKRAFDQVEASPASRQTPHNDDQDEDGTDGGTRASGGGTDELNPRSQCLPVGEVPEDGIALDGAQFLALAMQANDSLPAYKSVPNPYRAYSPSAPAGAEEAGDHAASAAASSSRHPALPKGSWGVTFPIHFTGYRKHLSSSWPPSPVLPYPSGYPALPNAAVRSEWYMFINGYSARAIKDSRARSKASNPSNQSKSDSKGKAKVLDEEEAMNSALLPSEPKDQQGADEVDMDLDVDDEEEEDEGVSANIAAKGKGKGKGKWKEKDRGPPREPLVGVIQRITSNGAIQILAHFALWLDETISQLPSPFPSDPSDLLPTQPLSPGREQAESNREDEYNISRSTAPIPLSTNYFRWIFALLLVVDRQLSSEQVSTLRELARAAMRVAGWRWIRAVVAREIKEGWELGSGSGKRHRHRHDAVASRRNEAEEVVGAKETETGKRVKGDNDDNDDDDELDTLLARCWIIVHAVSSGWGQTDLLEDLEQLFT